MPANSLERGSTARIMALEAISGVMVISSSTRFHPEAAWQYSRQS
ncbi:Uncharacterised protein [Mycobacteroides abscessus]|nr:Uncharacterised protein [Mycobacteroides abscessus]